MRIAILVLALSGCQSSDVSRSLGARCDLTAECDDRCLPPSASWPGGFCTLTCDSDADCPTGAACIDEEGGVCAFTCSTDPGCAFLGADYRCLDFDRHGDVGNRVAVCRGS